MELRALVGGLEPMPEELMSERKRKLMLIQLLVAAFEIAPQNCTGRKKKQNAIR